MSLKFQSEELKEMVHNFEVKDHPMGLMPVLE